MSEVDKTANEVLDMWERSDKFLRETRRNYWLNRAFYENCQYIWWDSKSRRPVITEPGRNERVRVTVNKIEPRIDLLIGTMADRDLTFEGEPSDADDQSIAGSQLGVSILDSVRVDQDWEGVREENLFNALLGGTSAVALEWDSGAGEPLQVADDGKVTGTGDVSLSALSIAEFSLEPGVRKLSAANRWISATASPAKSVKERFNLSWEPEADTNRQFTPMQRYLADPSEGQELVTTYVMYERPHRKKKGRVVVVVNDKTVMDDPWPFNFEELNLSVFRQGRISMRWHGKTFVTAARPVQVLYNMVRSQIAENIKLAGNPRLWVPKGALDESSVLTDEPGEMVEYHAQPNEPAPHYEAPAGLPRSTLDEAERLSMELDDIMHAHDVARGQAPGDRNSGLALSILAEKNNTPLGPMSRDQARGWGRIGTLTLQQYEKNASEKRIATVTSPSGVASKKEWTGKDLRGQTKVRVPLDAVAPHSKAQVIASLQSLQQLNPAALQAIPVEKMLRLTGLANERQLQQYIDSNAAKAHRENDRMSVGQVAIPEDWENHATHIAEHNDFRNSPVFENLPGDIKELFQHHIMSHQQLSQQEIQGQQQLNAISPNLGAAPQAHAPVGSAIPPPISEQLKAMGESLT